MKSDWKIENAVAKARLYLDDHIAHDAPSHYPDLLKTLEKYAGEPETANRIKFGADQVREAKGEFYKDLEERMNVPA